MGAREILGHIDCPTCGLSNGMRVTPDRNGEPFGFCEAGCDQQLRIGGKPRRVNAFYASYPHVRRPGTVTVTEPETPAKPEKAEPVTVPEERAPALPARKGTGNALLDFVSGVK